MKPDDKLTNDDPISPGDAFESPREESIVTTDPLTDVDDDDAIFGEVDPPHDIDLARAHGPESAAATGNQARTPSWPALAGTLLLVLWGGLYLGTYSGGFGGDVFNEAANYKPVAGAPLDPVKASIALGQKLFTANCVQCHQSSGLGQPGQFPPLVASEWVIGDAPKRLTQILLHGIQGTIHVKGGIYNNNMPAWNTVLNDKQIAAILSYVRQEWGNNASPISEADIAAARTETAGRSDPWTEAELLKIPAGPLGGAGAAGPAPAGNQPAGATANPANAGSDAKPGTAPQGQGPAPAPAPKP